MKALSDFDKFLGRFLGFITLLLLFRIIYSGTTHFVFLGWNIFLAWVPYALSTFYKSYHRTEKWKQVLLFCSWFLFFPNALYIVTDLVHLQADNNMPWWFDSFLVFSASFIGLLLAFISLRRTEHFLHNFFRRKTVKALMPLILFVASFGVYLGRFQRWNSWDVINNPVGLGIDILAKMMNPVQHFRVWLITLLLTVVYSFLYTTIKKIPRAIAEIKNTG